MPYLVLGRKLRNDQFCQLVNSSGPAGFSSQQRLLITLVSGHVLTSGGICSKSFLRGGWGFATWFCPWDAAHRPTCLSNLCTCSLEIGVPPTVLSSLSSSHWHSFPKFYSSLWPHQSSGEIMDKIYLETLSSLQLRLLNESGGERYDIIWLWLISLSLKYLVLWFWWSKTNTRIYFLI